MIGLLGKTLSISEVKSEKDQDEGVM